MLKPNSRFEKNYEATVGNIANPSQSKMNPDAKTRHNKTDRKRPQKHGH